ncbi:Duf674 family protein [Thalictrum thalictroides]|uniref:Duf674 family protein n=1 Tax=Thalictrum thalictroides TaxID=46969 RepID=A0A7J6V4E2_THATH|nr:Duf674 family protein [Thalictrum thalictroides]
MVMLKLVVEKEKNRVLFAESSKDLVDILFSFLTFPIGTIIRLTNKESNFGCMDNLYKSVEGLDIQYFHTKACKAMLLSPRSDSELKYRNLVLDLININDHMKYYACPSWTCATETHCVLSLFENATCLCGQEMQELGHTAEDRCDRVAFVEGNCKFIITDDLHVSIMSTEARESILRRFNIIEGLSIEERFVHLGTREVFKLLKHSLVFKTPMTDVILEQGDILTSQMVKSEPLEYLKLQIYPTQTEEKRYGLETYN